MGESNGAWGDMPDDEARSVWDTFSPLPDPGENDALDAFVERKNIRVEDLVRVGARLARPTVLAFAFPGGLKYRDIITGKRWSYDGSTWDRLHIIPSVNGSVGSDTIILAEGETDAAWLSGTYPCDVGVLPAGARTWKPAFTEQVRDYERVLVGLDDDAAGESGALLVQEAVPHAERFAPPRNDWCSLDRAAAPDLPGRDGPQEVVDTPTSILVAASELVRLKVPEVVSWLDRAVLPIGGTLVLHGSFKSYKSWMALDLMAALAAGESWAEFDPTEDSTRVAVLQFEIPWPYYRERIATIRRHRANVADFDKNFLTYSPLSRPQLRAGQKEQEKRVIADLKEAEVSIVSLDPIRRMVGKANMNDEDGAPAAVRGFVEALQAEGITVVLVHHDNLGADKYGGGDPAGMTGSGAWAGDPDTIVSVSRPKGEGREGTRRNVHFLLRNGPSPGPRGFKLGEDARVEWNIEPYAEQEEGDEEF